MKKIETIIKRFFMKDIGWKLLSIIIALGLWLMVINIEDPIETRGFTTGIVFENEDKLANQGYVITNKSEIEGSKIEIRVRSQRLSLDRLWQNRSDIKATVDFQKALTGNDGDTIPLTVNVTLPNPSGDSFEVLSKSPPYINVKIEPVSKIEKSIEIDVSGNPSTGYIISEPQINPNTIIIRGPQSEVSKVATVKVSVDVEGASSDINVSAVPVAYDAEGIKLTGVIMSTEAVKISVPVSKSKRVPVKVTTQGIPEEGFSVGEIKWTPEYVDVIGSDEALSKITEIVLPVVSIQNKTNDIEETYYLGSLLPDGVYVRDNADSNVIVTVKITKQSQSLLSYSSNQISLEGTLSDNLKASFMPLPGTLTVKGPSEIISTIEASKLQGKVNITGLPVGTHEVAITFDLPEGAILVGDLPLATVTVVDGNAVNTEPEPDVNVDADNIPSSEIQ